MTRLLEASDESRERRIDEVLQANLSLTPHAEADRQRTAEDVVHEVMFRPRWDSRMEVFSRIKDCLGSCIEARRALISSKAERLCQEYVVRNEEWHSYCASLDEQARQATAAIELVPPQQPGRTTRRSAAYLGLGNIIYSDLEMEQVIASIGYNEATDPILLAKRNMATIPDMISVTNGAVDYTFDSDNLLVDDPHEHFATHTGIYDWTEEEKAIMLEHYGNTPKQFGLIADHLPYKTAEQCVQYYYLHKKKLVNFRKAVNKRKRRGGRMGKGKANALLTDIRQHDAEVKGGAVTPEPVVISSGRRGRKKTRAATLQDDACTSTATSTPEPELDGSKRKANEISSPRSVSMDTDVCIYKSKVSFQISPLM
ncbi:hypothetical protein FISHEDRAFT_45420 [Fistulina hepatica ATCC 64428]|uniref:SANT domain-containing protein n=1 Tax=Fistulina hepatica ATCC 64428 TaxID=1128425 RepID=A0A0D7A8V7_9AGAR|nr:hypothetical protein FISHEDRAFT_45420 [Fistulina hepatica ATCC 64428]